MKKFVAGIFITGVFCIAVGLAGLYVQAHQADDICVDRAYQFEASCIEIRNSNHLELNHE